MIVVVAGTFIRDPDKPMTDAERREHATVFTSMAAYRASSVAEGIGFFVQAHARDFPTYMLRGAPVYLKPEELTWERKQSEGPVEGPVDELAEQRNKPKPSRPESRQPTSEEEPDDTRAS